MNLNIFIKFLIKKVPVCVTYRHVCHRVKDSYSSTVVSSVGASEED